jgi:hypothetical protein
MERNAKQPLKHRVNPQALSLYDQTIPLVNYSKDPDSCKKALALLDSATSIDDSCFSCYFNKLFFLNISRPDKQIFLIANNLIRLQPFNHSLFLMRGAFYEEPVIP